VVSCSGDKIEKNDMRVACSSDAGEDKRVRGFGGETGGNETTGET
jgi:hypothetical protein